MLRAVYDGFIRILSVKLKLNIMKNKKVLKTILAITSPIWIGPFALFMVIYGLRKAIVTFIDDLFDYFGWDKKP